MKESLINTDPDQPSLLPDTAPSFFAELESKGEFTGERLWHQRPDTYKAVVVLLAKKVGVIQIGRLLQVSPNTVMAVRDREGCSIDSVKEHLARVAHEGATLASEGIRDALSDILKRKHCLAVKDLKDLAVVYGILVQNGQLLAGQPTARLEITDLKKPDHDDFNRYIASLPALQITHLEGETAGQKEAQEAQKEGREESGSVREESGPAAPGADSQSEVSGAKP